MATQRTLAGADSKRRRMTDRSGGPGRRNARQAAARRNDVVQAQAAADPSIAAKDALPGGHSAVEDGESCRDERGQGATSPAATSASASRARVDAAAVEAGGVPSATGTATRTAKRTAAGGARVAENRVARRRS